MLGKKGALKVSWWCLEGVLKALERSLEGVGRCLEGVWKVSRKYLKGVLTVFGMCFEGKRKMCLKDVWKVLEGLWKLYGRCLQHVWKVSGRYLEGVHAKVSGGYLEGFWRGILKFLWSFSFRRSCIYMNWVIHVCIYLSMQIFEHANIWACKYVSM